MANVNISKAGSFCSYLSAIWAFPAMLLAYVHLETSASSASSTVSNGASRIRHISATCPHSIAVGGTAFVLNARFSLNRRERLFRARRTALTQTP